MMLTKHLLLPCIPPPPSPSLLADAALATRASFLQAWVEGALALASRQPLLLQFLQEDGSFTETAAEAEAAAAAAAASPEEDQGEPVIAEYQCLRRCQIRAEAAMDSEKAGVLDMGASVSVYEERTLDSGATVSLRCVARADVASYRQKADVYPVNLRQHKRWMTRGVCGQVCGGCVSSKVGAR